MTGREVFRRPSAGRYSDLSARGQNVNPLISCNNARGVNPNERLASLGSRRRPRQADGSGFASIHGGG
jgi:hypothetical protein